MMFRSNNVSCLSPLHKTFFLQAACTFFYQCFTVIIQPRKEKNFRLLLIFLLCPASLLQNFKVASGALTSRYIGPTLDSFSSLNNLLSSDNLNDPNKPSRPVDIKFLTNPRPNHSNEDVHGFHVIELNSKSFGAEGVAMLHVVKTPVASDSLRSIVRSGNNVKKIEKVEEDTDVEHYMGHINGGVSGSASITLSIDHKHQSALLTGLLLTDEGQQWLIEPHPDPAASSLNRSTYKIKGDYTTVPHSMLQIDPEFSNKPVSDVIHLNASQLREVFGREKSVEDEEMKKNETRHEMVEDEAMSKKGETERIVVVEKDENDKTLVLQSLLSPLTRTLHSSSRDAVSSKSNHVTNPSYTVELAVFVDGELYNLLRKKFPSSTDKKIEQYVSTIVNMVNLMYQHPSLEVDLSFKLVHFEILKKSPTNLKNYGGKAKAYLTSFCEYAGSQNKKNNLWDHALLLTGLDLYEDGMFSTAGLAWAGTMCFRYYSCSISEGKNFGASYIITHEIGHSLGMEHDGHGVSARCDKDKYIMSPTTGPGKIYWSPCSSENLRNFIKYGSSELRRRRGKIRPTCLTQLTNSEKTDYSVKKLPGELYDAAKQCSIGYGPTFRPFQEKKEPFNNICWVLYCGNSTHAISTHPALEGTKCSYRKYCRKGACVTVAD